MDEFSLPEGVNLPFEAQHHTITPFFKHKSVMSVPDSEKAGHAVYELKEMVELRFAGDRNYSPCFESSEMWRMVNNRVVTFAERFSDQYRAFVMGDTQKAGGTALEMLKPYGITPAQISICNALKIYSIEAIAELGGPNAKALGMNANSLKQMASAFLTDREKRGADKVSDDVEALKAEIDRLRAMIPAKETPPEEIDRLVASADAEFEAMSDDQLKDWIAAKTGTGRPRGNPSHETLVGMARELAA